MPANSPESAISSLEEGSGKVGKRISFMVQIGYCSIELHFPGCRSLKEKRMILKGLKMRLRNRFNLALAEEDYSDLWQRSKLALVTVGPDKQSLINTFERVLEHIDQNGSIQVTGTNMEYF